ncbi:hypothetical protein SPHINGOT1_80019 [Sphingomonas sp. T1]|nr:hypothetical protein SPHINGOT1_80019 [Sphingomonas sp. T1]
MRCRWEPSTPTRWPFDEQRHEAVGVEIEAIRPGLITGEIDAVLAKRREPGQHSRIDRRPATAHFVNSTTEIRAVGQDDRSGDEIESSSPGLNIFRATIAKTAKPMERDCPDQTVTSLALVQFGCDRAARSRILEPSAVTVSTRLRGVMRRICANRRSINRKLPRVMRITAACGSIASSWAGRS